MLDKYLCKLAGISPFLEWLMNELDRLEDILHSESATADIKAITKIKYETLLTVRDQYCELHNNNKNKEGSK